MTTLEDILRMSGMQPLVSPQYPTPAKEVNLTPFMHATCADIALELLARVEQTSGLEMVDTHTLMELMHGLQTELCLRHTA